MGIKNGNALFLQLKNFEKTDFRRCGGLTNNTIFLQAPHLRVSRASVAIVLDGVRKGIGYAIVLHVVLSDSDD